MSFLETESWRAVAGMAIASAVVMAIMLLALSVG